MSTLHEHGAAGYPRASHTNDPASSHMAEAGHTRSGRRQRNVDRVLSVLRQRPRSTAAEIAHHAGMDVVEVRRRLYDLHMRKPCRALACGLRTCTVGNRQVQTWEATADA